jgi:DNA-binding transcriptional LysR family regulator
MELYQLRAFVAVARQGNFTRAAEELHLSQPTISGQIKSLEEALGVLLFERRAGGVALTAAGLELLGRAERILAEVHDFSSHADRLTGRAHPKIRLGVSGDAKAYRVGKLLEIARERHPELEIVVHNGLSGWIMNAVRADELDCGYFVGPIEYQDVVSTVLDILTYRIVAPAAWADRLEQAGWDEIGAMPWVLTPELAAPRRIAMKMFREHGIQPTKATIVDRESTVAHLVSSGVGLALLREKLAQETVLADEVVLWKNGSTLADLSFICLERRKDDPIIAAATRIVHEIWS